MDYFYPVMLAILLIVFFLLIVTVLFKGWGWM